MSNAEEILHKSVAAALSAIEVYNKPDFKYREETFAILMVNAWELVLKAKVIKDSGDDPQAIVEMERESGSGRETPKLNRSGNPMTHGLTYLANRLVQQANTGFSKECHRNIELILELRDNAVHFINKDTHFRRRVQEVGAASLRNYVSLVTEWFAFDLSQYNFFLMPLSFWPETDILQTMPSSSQNQYMQNFLHYIETAEGGSGDRDSALGEHSVTLRIQTRIVRSKEVSALPIRLTTDPAAPELRVSEESILERYPYDYNGLRRALQQRYVDFKANKKYHALRRELEKQGDKYCHVRLLDPRNSGSGQKRWYSTAVLEAFDRHYTRRVRGASSGSK